MATTSNNIQGGLLGTMGTYMATRRALRDHGYIYGHKEGS